MLQKDQTRAEAQQRADMMFQMLDANHDGTVTRAEADQALAQFQASRGENGGHGGGRLQRMIDEAFATSQSLTLQQFEASRSRASTRRTSITTARSRRPSASSSRQQRRASGAVAEPGQASVNAALRVHQHPEQHGDRGGARRPCPRATG